jgi:hypothetical protein
MKLLGLVLQILTVPPMTWTQQTLSEEWLGQCKYTPASFATASYLIRTVNIDANGEHHSIYLKKIPLMRKAIGNPSVFSVT